MEIKIASVEDLRKLNPLELERQANLLLYGHPNVLEAACEREIIHRLYIPRNLNKSIEYVEPKHTSFKYTRFDPQPIQRKCCECNRPMNRYSGQRCRHCYLLGARLKFYEASEGHSWLEFQGRGIVMPETEWWDDSDIPAQPKRLGPIGWGGIDRVNYAAAKSAVR